MKYSKTKISIYDYGISINRGLRLIDRFKEINELEFELEVKIDFSESDLGYYYYSTHDKVIYINPIKCVNNESKSKNSKSKSKKNKMRGNPKDNSPCSVIAHEFSHFLDHKFKLLKDYEKQEFTKPTLAMTKYAKKEVIEQLADCLALYLINPYCLKLIDEERFEWCKSKFKTPSVCGEKTFIGYFINWPKKQRELFERVYKISVKNDKVVMLP